MGPANTGPTNPTRRTVDPMPSDRHYRPYTIAPGWPVEVEVHGADGTHLVIVGTVDSVPHSAANTIQRIVVKDAQARVVEHDEAPPA